MDTTRKIIRNIVCLAAAAFFFAACDKDVFDINTDPFKNEVYSTTLMSPISSFLEEQEGYGEYVKMLRYANMFNALNQSSSGTSFTAFVPNDDAMREFYRRRGVDSLEQLSKEYAKAFVLYHTVKDSILPESFVQKKSVQNLSGDVINITIDPQHAGQAILNNEGCVVEMGLSAYNGKVYVLSSAMTPLVETVYDRVVQGGRSRIMAEALQATGWAGKLSIVVDTTINEERQKVINHYYYTLLNVSDATFAKAGVASLDQLRQVLRSTDKEGLAEDSLLRKYVGYHILQNQYTTDEMGAMVGSEPTRIWSSSASNQVFTVTYDSLATSEADKFVLNGSGVSARFVPEESNVLCKNGYVHELDGWLPVWEPEQATVLWDLADYTEIKNLVDPEYYQPAEPTASEQRFRVASAACFEYEMGEAGSKNRNYSDIDYVTCRSNMKDAHNYDRIVFNLGYMGKVSMRTPTIVRGKYKVELTLVFMTGNNFMRQQTDGNGGMLKMAFDEKDEYTVFTAPYTKVTSALPGVYTSTIYEEIEFPETASHDFSFIVLDPAASTNSNFSLQFDYIKFTPIE
ncbi:MAG: DUF5108 domain-containing protein [Prevotella sp.]|nr:DUF5108 domain-containing protein [Prevotella sp.]